MNTLVAIRIENAAKAFSRKTQRPLTRLNPAAEVSPAAGIALDDLSFEVLRGEIFGVVGPNGSGKTTLVRLIAAHLAPDAGRVAVFGQDTAAEPRLVQTSVGLAGRADGSLFKKLSPVENLLYGARQYALRPGETRRRVLDILGRLGLRPDDYYRPLDALSGGTQQKVAIARAFLSEPRVLLLDEPTTGLDPRARREVQAFVRELRDRHETTVLLTTHDMLEAETLCDRVAVMQAGRLVALDTPAALKHQLGAPAGAAATLEDVFLELTRQPELAEEAEA